MIFHGEELNYNDFFDAFEKLLNTDAQLMMLEYYNDW